MKKPVAYFNHGRWLYNCPVCDTPLEARRDICPQCHPGIVARAFQPVKGSDLLRRVPDPELIEQARLEAVQRGEVWKPVYPKEKQAIENILRYRRIQHMNWQPGETLEFLLAENRQNGDEVPKEYRERKH